MGESKRRQDKDALYGIVPKAGNVPLLWTVHKGVLFLIVGGGDSLTCLPASSYVIPNEKQVEALEELIASNSQLLTQVPPAINVAEPITDRVEVRTTIPTIEGPALIATPVQQSTFDLTAI